jgi:hypothetical protein
MKYSSDPFFPNWKYIGRGGEHQICKIYAKSATYEELEAFFGHSAYTLNQSGAGFQFGDHVLKCLHTGKALDFYQHELVSNTGYVRFTEGTKDSPQGQMYQGEVRFDPDSDSLARWTQELNSHARPTLFVILFSQGGGRIIGNYNGGAIMESKFDGGGRKSNQDRELAYKWQSQHPSFFLDETDVFFPEYFIRCKDLSGNRFTSASTGESYFRLKFDKTPYNFKYISGSLYFQVPTDTTINDVMLNGNVNGFEFEDPTGRIIGVTDSSGTFGGTSVSYVKLTAPIFTVHDSNGVATGMDRAEVKTLRFTGSCDGCFMVDRLKAHLIKVEGTLINSFNDINTMLIGDQLMSVSVEASGNMTISFQRMGLGSMNTMPWKNLDVKGFINDCFRDGRHAMYDITVYDLATANLTNAFSDSGLLLMQKVYLGYGTDNSFQRCSNVSFESLDMKEVASQAGNSWFMSCVNISVRKIGSTVGVDGLADLATNKFVSCSGAFLFKIGYNTINAGGIEGDVAVIISSGSPSSISYTL